MTFTYYTKATERSLIHPLPTSLSSCYAPYPLQRTSLYSLPVCLAILFKGMLVMITFIILKPTSSAPLLGLLFGKGDMHMRTTQHYIREDPILHADHSGRAF